MPQEESRRAISIFFISISCCAIFLLLSAEKHLYEYERNLLNVRGCCGKGWITFASEWPGGLIGNWFAGSALNEQVFFRQNGVFSFFRVDAQDILKSLEGTFQAISQNENQDGKSFWRSKNTSLGFTQIKQSSTINLYKILLRIKIEGYNILKNILGPIKSWVCGN